MAKDERASIHLSSAPEAILGGAAKLRFYPKCAAADTFPPALHLTFVRVSPRFVVFVAILQAILFLAHFFLYETWVSSVTSDSRPGYWLPLLLAFLSISFVAASLLAFRYDNFLVRALYRVASVWLGLLSFLFFAASLFWILRGIAWAANIRVNAHDLVAILFAVAAMIGIYGVCNAALTRVRRITVRLRNLPDPWRGRRIVLVSDMHLGHVYNGRFTRRIVQMVMRQNPDSVFIAGDLYDGTIIDAEKAAAPLRELHAPLGTYFVAGNHEQFGDDSRYLQAVSRTGVRVLRNEKVDLDGLQVIGVPYRDATHDAHLRSVLQRAGVDRGRASILLTHAPDRPGIAAEAGISLQLSGHTHLGQFVPWTWFAKRMYRQYVYGLHRWGQMQIYTSSGAGTWGPPLRVGSQPEIVVFQLEAQPDRAPSEAGSARSSRPHVGGIHAEA
ncbi:MAG TPA: metallophosphoesterase [Candidatus Acidoferrales bacterium]|nr:metallophosphoesterase [Candidatus Acidoferrales bacterium]